MKREQESEEKARKLKAEVEERLKREQEEKARKLKAEAEERLKREQEENARKEKAEAEEKLKREQEEKAKKKHAEAEAESFHASPWNAAQIDLDLKTMPGSVVTEAYECEMGKLKKKDYQPTGRPEIDAENEARAKEIQECERKFQEAQAAWNAAKERKAALEAQRDLLEAKTLRLGGSTTPTESVVSSASRQEIMVYVFAEAPWNSP